jgi:hypothetical protein
MSVTDFLPDWVKRELEELRKAPVGSFALLLIGAAIGFYVGAWHYAERIAVLQLQLDAELAKRGVVYPTPVLRWPGAILWTVAVVAFFACGLLVVSRRRKTKEMRALINRVDALQESVRNGLTERGHLLYERNLLEKQRDQAREERDAEKRGLGVERLHMYSSMSFDGVKPVVTVRVAEHSDRALAKDIEKIFKDLNWAVTIEAANDPLLASSDEFKVIFESSDRTTSFGHIANAFEQGQLLGVKIGCRQSDRSDVHHLVVEVLPTVRR